MKVQVIFRSRDPKYAITDTAILIPTHLKRFGLSEIINHLLATSSPIPFDFIISGSFLTTSLQTWLDSNNVSNEHIVTIEFVESTLPPDSSSTLKHDDWISSVSIHPDLYLV